MHILKEWAIFSVLACAFLIVTPVTRAAESPAMRPATVAVATVQKGEVSPQSVWIGTVRYPNISEVAAEVSGKVERVAFDAGQRVQKGEILVTLDLALLKKALAAQEARYQQAEADRRKAGLHFARIETLYKGQSVAEQEYDNARLDFEALSKLAAFHAAERDRLAIELAKGTIRSPFDGVVLAKMVDKGEWLDPGTVVGSVADDSTTEVLLNVDQKTLPLLRIGMEVPVAVGGTVGRGGIFAFVPKGDIATRTFPVKIRINNPETALWDGMEARVTLPSGPRVVSLVVNRDAVIGTPGRQIIFVAREGKARMVPVRVTGYEAGLAGITADGISEGAQVVVKGNERLRDGQPLQIIKQ